MFHTLHETAVLRSPDLRSTSVIFSTISFRYLSLLFVVPLSHVRPWLLSVYGFFLFLLLTPNLTERTQNLRAKTKNEIRNIEFTRTLVAFLLAQRITRDAIHL